MDGRRSTSARGHTEGQKSGEETHTLSVNEMPQHRHLAEASNADGDTQVPTGSVLARALNLYANPGTAVVLESGTVTNVGGSQAHDNMQPYLALNFCIALQGLFPSRN